MDQVSANYLAMQISKSRHFKNLTDLCTHSNPSNKQTFWEVPTIDIHLSFQDIKLYTLGNLKIWISNRTCVVRTIFPAPTICAHIVYIPIVIFQKHVNKDIFTCQRRMQWIVQSHPVAPAIHLFSWPKTAWFFFYKALTIEAFRALYNVLHVGKWTKATKETWALPN